MLGRFPKISELNLTLVKKVNGIEYFKQNPVPMKSPCLEVPNSPQEELMDETSIYFKPTIPINLQKKRKRGSGVSMKVGALIIAWIFVGYGLIIAIPPLLYGADFIDFVSNTTIQSQTMLQEMKMNVITTNTDYRLPSDYSGEQAVFVFKTLLSVWITVGTFILFISLMLVFGILKEIRCCMIPWLICQGVVCVFSVLIFLIIAILPPIAFLFMDKSFPVPLVGTYIYFVELISTGTNAFVSLLEFYIVRAHYKDLKTQKLGFPPYGRM